MISKQAIKFRAVKMGIATGLMPDVDFIWNFQRTEGSIDCFGLGLRCATKNCRWRSQCVGLDFFADVSLSEIISNNNKAVCQDEKSASGNKESGKKNKQPDKEKERVYN